MFSCERSTFLSTKCRKPAESSSLPNIFNIESKIPHLFNCENFYSKNCTFLANSCYTKTVIDNDMKHNSFARECAVLSLKDKWIL